MMVERHTGAGFTLVELLVAFTILLIGMTGIITMFSAGLMLEREGDLLQDTSLVQSELESEVRRELARRVAAGGESIDLDFARREVPGRLGLEWQADVVPVPDDDTGRAFLVRITVFSPGAPREREFTWGYLPVAVAPDHAKLIEDVIKRP